MDVSIWIFSESANLIAEKLQLYSCILRNCEINFICGWNVSVSVFHILDYVYHSSYQPIHSTPDEKFKPYTEYELRLCGDLKQVVSSIVPHCTLLDGSETVLQFM